MAGLLDEIGEGAETGLALGDAPLTVAERQACIIPPEIEPLGTTTREFSSIRSAQLMPDGLAI